MPSKRKMLEEIGNRHLRKEFIRIFVLISAVFVMNIILYFSLSLSMSGLYVETSGSPESMADDVSSALSCKDGSYILSDESASGLDSLSVWGMLVSDSTGDVVWSHNLPDTVSRHYRISDFDSLASMNMAGYPVFMASHPDGLVVLGYPEGSYINVPVSQPVDNIGRIRNTVLIFIIVVILILILLSVIYGWSSYKALKGIVKGIDDLSIGRPVHLKDTGRFSAIASCVNTASDRLQGYSAHRKKWIAGVSHDIRTPLAIILGKADKAGDSDIKFQAVRIRELINDLNMYSALEFSEAIDKKRLRMSAFVRNTAADFLNALPEEYSLSVNIDEAAENKYINGDTHLLQRALYNLLYNSIVHNASGCDMSVSLGVSGKKLKLVVSDNGTGISPEILKELNLRSLSGAKIPDENIRGAHGLGLYIVAEIIRLHKGTVMYSNVVPKGFRTEILL